MFCKNCGSQVPEGAMNCPMCGSAVGTPAAAQMGDLTGFSAGNPAGQQPAAMPQIPAVPPQAPQTPPAPAMAPLPDPMQSAAPAGNQQPAFGQQPAGGYQQPAGGYQQPAFGQQPAGGQQPAAPAPNQQSAFGQQSAGGYQQTAFGQQPAGGYQQTAFGRQPGYGQPQPAGYGAAPSLGGTGLSAPGVKKLPFRLIAKVMIVLALLCFFLPFVSVSCSMGSYGGEQEIGKYSGFDMMLGNMETKNPTSDMSNMFGGSNSFGNGLDDDEDDWDWYDDDEDTDDDSSSSSSSDDETESTSASEKKNYWLWAAFACGVLAFGVMFIKGKKLEIAGTVLSAAAGALVAVSRITFKSFYKFDELDSMDTSDLGGAGMGKMSDMLKVNTKAGLIICIILFAAAAAVCFLEFANSKKQTQNPY